MSYSIFQGGSPSKRYKCSLKASSYLPYGLKAVVHPPLTSRAQRHALFDRCLSNLPDFNKFTALWFQTGSVTDVKRDNYIDWLLWALFSTDRQGCIAGMDSIIDEELNGYMDQIEAISGRKIEPGRNPLIKPLRLTLDPVVMLPRPLVWYAVSVKYTVE